MGVYGIAVLSFFSCGISVILILTCGIAVSSNSAVCGFSSFWLTVFGETHYFDYVNPLAILTSLAPCQLKIKYDIILC